MQVVVMTKCLLHYLRRMRVHDARVEVCEWIERRVCAQRSSKALKASSRVAPTRDVSVGAGAIESRRQAVRQLSAHQTPTIATNATRPCPNPTVSRASGTLHPGLRCVYCFLPHTDGHSPPRKVHKSRVLRLEASRSPLYMYFLTKSLKIQRAFRERDASVRIFAPDASI